MTGIEQIPFHVFVGHLFEKHTFRQVFWVLVGWCEVSPLSYSTSSHVTVICPLHLVRWMVCTWFVFCRLCLYNPTEAFAVCRILICVLLLLFPHPRSPFLFHYPEGFLLEVSQFCWSSISYWGEGSVYGGDFLESSSVGLDPCGAVYAGHLMLLILTVSHPWDVALPCWPSLPCQVPPCIFSLQLWLGRGNGEAR